MKTYKYHPGRHDPVTGLTVYSIVGHELYGDSDVLARIFGKPVREHGRSRMAYTACIDDERNETGIEMGPYRYLRVAKRELNQILAVYLDGTPVLAGLMAIYEAQPSQPGELSRTAVRRLVERVADEGIYTVEQVAEFYLATGETPGVLSVADEIDRIRLWRSDQRAWRDERQKLMGVVEPPWSIGEDDDKRVQQAD